MTVECHPTLCTAIVSSILIYDVVSSPRNCVYELMRVDTRHGCVSIHCYQAQCVGRELTTATL